MNVLWKVKTLFYIDPIMEITGPDLKGKIQSEITTIHTLTIEPRAKVSLPEPVSEGNGSHPS